MFDIRADIGRRLLNEGEFNTAAPGLTVFIRELARNGEIRGILVHDNRDRARPSPISPRAGILAQTPAGARLIMQDGTIEASGPGRRAVAGAAFRELYLRPRPVRRPGALRAAQDQRALSGRIAVAAGNPGHDRSASATPFFAEAHNRLAQPLYCIAFALIALAAVMRGRRQRGSIALRMTVAGLVAAGLRIAATA